MTTQTAPLNLSRRKRDFVVVYLADKLELRK